MNLPRLPPGVEAPVQGPGEEYCGREIFELPPGRTRADGGPVFNTVELAPVIEAEGNCEAFDSLDEIPEELRDQVFWSLYGHTPGEGVQCLGDFRSRVDALEALVRLFGDLAPAGRLGPYPGGGSL